MEAVGRMLDKAVHEGRLSCFNVGVSAKISLTNPHYPLKSLENPIHQRKDAALAAQSIGSYRIVQYG